MRFSQWDMDRENALDNAVMTIAIGGWVPVSSEADVSTAVHIELNDDFVHRWFRFSILTIIL